MWIIVLIGLVFPRLAAIALYVLTNWFEGIFQTWFIPILGLIFAPYTLLWYSVVVNWYGGVWGTLQIIVFVIAILADLGVSQKWLRS